MTEGKIKFFNKPNKTKMGALLLIFIWILVWNILYEAFHAKLIFGSVHIVSWPFFMSVIVFFLREELSYKERFFHTLFGGAIGLSLAAGLIYIYATLAKNSVTPLAAICIPLTVILFILIVLEPIFPVFFNNIGLAYFVIALINSKEAVSILPSYLISLVLGCVVLNLGCVFILSAYTKAMKKKIHSA